MIIVDEEDNICLCGKVNYNFKFSKSNSYDLFIQDFVCNQILNKPLPFEYLINQFCQKLEEFESRNQYNVHRKFILSNHFISSLHHIFIKKWIFTYYINIFIYIYVHLFFSENASSKISLK